MRTFLSIFPHLYGLYTTKGRRHPLSRGECGGETTGDERLEGWRGELDRRCQRFPRLMRAKNRISQSLVRETSSRGDHVPRSAGCIETSEARSQRRSGQAVSEVGESGPALSITAWRVSCPASLCLLQGNIFSSGPGLLETIIHRCISSSQARQELNEKTRRGSGGIK